MRINDAITGILIIAFSILIIMESRSFPVLPGVPYGPGLFPTIIAVCMILGGCNLVFKGVPQLNSLGWFHLEPWAKSPGTYITLGLIFLALVFYILFSEKLGFLPTSMVILFCLMLWTRGRSHVWSSTVISISFSVAAYLIFAKLMRVPLPEGILIGLF